MIPLQILFSNRTLSKTEQRSRSFIDEARNKLISEGRYEKFLTFLTSINRSNSYKQNIQYSDVQNNFIYNVESTENQNKASFLYSVENNNFFEPISPDLLDDIVVYKKELIKNKFKKLENKFNMFTNVKSNAEALHSIFTSKFSNNNLIIKEIKDGIVEKVEKVKSNSFESLLKNDVINGDNSLYFFQITNYFNDKRNIALNRSSYSDRESSELKKIKKKSKDKNIKNSLLTDSLISIYNPDTDEYIKEIKTTSNDLIIQNFINLSRSLYTLSPNSLLQNIKPEITTRFIDFELESLKCFQSEIEGFDVFSYIDENSQTCTISYPNNINSLKNLYFKNYASDIDNVLTNNINSLNRNFNVLKHDVDQTRLNNYFLSLTKSINTKLLYINRDDDNNNVHYYKNLTRIISNTNSADLITTVANEFNLNPVGYIARNNDDFNNILVNFLKLLNGGLYNSILTGLKNTEISSIIYQINNYLSNNEFIESYQGYFINDSYSHIIANNLINTNNADFNSIYYRNNHAFIYFDEYKSGVEDSDFSRNPNFYQNIIKTPYNILHKKYRRLKPNKEFDTDYHIDLDDIEYKLKIDSFVKKVKLESLKNKNIDISFLNEIVTNIKKIEDNNQVLISYCLEDTEDFSCLNKENEIFNFLFTKNEDEKIVYSHSDIVSDHEINGTKFLGLEELKKSNLEINNLKIDSFKNKFKKLLSNYYPINKFFSSSSFYKNVLQSIINEAENSNFDDYFNYSLIQSIYFNYYNNKNLDSSSSLEVKKVIAKRFLKKAIMLDGNTSTDFTSSKMSDFIYKIDEISRDDFDLLTEQGNEDYLEAIINSSENLSVIRKNIFSSENIENLNNQVDFKSFKKFKVNNKYKPYTQDILNVNNISFNELSIVLPYVFSICNVVNKFDKTFENLKTKNKIAYKNYIEYNREVNQETGNSEIVSIKKGYLPDTSFDIEKSYNIKASIGFYTNDSLSLREKGMDTIHEDFSNHIYSDSHSRLITIEDIFDKICEKNNMLFNSICNTIQDFIKIRTVSYNSTNFSSEESIDSFVSNNIDIIEDINKIIEFYSSLYFIYLNRVNCEYAIKSFNVFSKTKKRDDDVPSGQQNSIHILSDNNIFNFHNVDGDLSFYNLEIHTDCVSDIKRIIERINKEDFEKQERLSLGFNEDWNTIVTDKINNIYNSLYDSDLKQSFYFDLINAYIIHQEENIGKPLENLSSSDSFDNLRSILKEDIVNKIESNFYNLFFINKLSKNIFMDELLYKQYESNININTSSGSLDYYKNSNDDVLFFDADRVIEESFLNKNNFSFGEDILDKELFGKTLQEYFDSSFYNFGIDDNFLKNCNPYSIIKVTAIAVDQFNLNRLYIPKTYLFSPLLTDISFVSMSNIDSIGNQVSSDHIGFYDINKNVNERLMSFNINNEDEINDIKTYFKNIIKNKFKNIKDDIESDASDFDLNNLVNYLFKCHLMSSKSKNLSKVLYDTDSFDNKNRKIIDKKIVELTDELSEKEFYNIFDHKRDKVRNKLTEFIDNFELPNAYDSIKDKSCFYMLNDYLSNVGSFNSIEKLEGEDYYDTYCIPININNFKYINIEDNQFSTVNSFDYAGNENLISIHKIISDFDIDFLLKDDIYIKNHKNKNTSFNIFFKVQVLN